jgi:hypothetical protein
MIHRRIRAGVLALAAALMAAGLACSAPSAQEKSSAKANTAPVAKAKDAPLYVGLRRSSYGSPKHNADNAWWSDRARQYAAHFPGARPLVLEIVSTYQDKGTTQLEMARPADNKGPTDKIAFAGEGVDHDKALAEYDKAGVKAILQLEPGEADVTRCFEIAWRKLKAHPCLIGFAVDAEWYFTDKSRDKSGLPIPDAEAKKWMEQVKGFNPEFVLVLKHWDPKHLPPTYRDPNLWMLSDSQDFRSQAEWMADLTDWSKTYKDRTVGFQFGYPKDRKWWSKNDRPPADLGKTLLGAAPNCRCLLWVDFTADLVEFAAKTE